MSRNIYGGIFHISWTLLIKQKPNKKTNGVSLRDRTFFGNDVRRFSLTGVILAPSLGYLCPPPYNGILDPWVLNPRAQTQCRDFQTRRSPLYDSTQNGMDKLYLDRVNFSGLACFAEPVEIRKVRNHCTKPVAMETIKQ